MKEKRREESYAERIGESGAEAGGELLSRRHLEEGRPAPLPSYLKQHPLSLSLVLVLVLHSYLLNNSEARKGWMMMSFVCFILFYVSLFYDDEQCSS